MHHKFLYFYSSNFWTFLIVCILSSYIEKIYDKIDIIKYLKLHAIKDYEDNLEKQINVNGMFFNFHGIL